MRGVRTKAKKYHPSFLSNAGILNALSTANGAAVTFSPQRHCGIIRRKICVTATAMSSHTHENKHTRGVFQKLLWDGELKCTLPIQLSEFCCVTGTLHSCSKGNQANLVHVCLLHLPCLEVRLHNPDWLPVGKIQMPNRSHSRSFSNINSQSLTNYQQPQSEVFLSVSLLKIKQSAASSTFQTQQERFSRLDNDGAAMRHRVLWI